ncbi:MAG TPA: FecR family protein, partial [Sphingomicrobium sp.]
MKILSRFAIATTLLATASPVLAGTGPWTVSEAAGKVTVTDVSGTKPVARGMVIPAGATLTTGPGGRAVMVRGPEFVTVSANSRLRVAEAAQQTGLVQILQDWGNAMFRIDKQKNPHFAVKTPYLAAVVKGTTFSITVSREGASMQVVEGAVEVSTGDGGARDLIRPGSVAMVAA